MSLDMMPTAPVHTAVRDEQFYEGIDPGIRFAVRALHAAGIPTCQSCEGGDGHSYDLPSVDMVEARAFEAMAVLERHGLQVSSVSSIWRIDDGVPSERIWRVELRCHPSLHGLANARPQFVAGHLHRDCWEVPT